MMSKSALACLAAIAVLGAAAPVAAQTAPQVPAAAQGAEQQAKAALVRRYFDAIQFDKLMNVMMESMMASMMENGRIPEDKIPVLREAALEAFGNVLPQMVEANIEIYAQAFTLEELEQLVAFYESPVGRSLMAKTVVLSRQSGEMIQRFQPIMQEEMRRQLCARIDCPAAPPVVVAPSAGARAKP